MLLPKRRAMYTLLTAALLFLPTVRDAKADDFAYAEVSEGSLWGTVDLTTGTFTQLGTNAGLIGLGEVGGTIYGVGVMGGHGTGTLYRVNPLDGSLTTVGTGAASFDMIGSTATGLYGIDYSMNLYSIDPTTGADTLIGSTGLSLPDHNGLSTGANGLYVFAQYGAAAPNMYSINLLTGGATLAGSSAAVFGPVYENGHLYAETPTPFQINTVDPATAVNTFVSNVAGGGTFDGMVALNSVPEPSYVLVLLVAIVGLMYRSGLRLKPRARHLG